MADYRDIIKKYRMIYDHHTHTVYSHGKGTIEDNVRIAYEKGLESVAITEHGPGNFKFGVKLDNFALMREDISKAMAKYPGIEVKLGVEANTTLKEPYIDITPDECRMLDLVLAGYHYGLVQEGTALSRLHIWTRSLRNKNTEMIVNGLLYNEQKGNHISIITHPGDKGPFDIAEIAKACEKTGTLMEINGKHPHMTVEEIKRASKFDVRFVLSSDAHIPQNVGTFEAQLQRALEAGLEPERIVNITLK